MSCGTVCEGSAIVPDPDRTSELAANFFKPKEPNAPDEHGVPPLHRAVRAGFEAEVAELVAFRANVNARDALGQTALQLAIEEGHAGIADLLIEAGADVDAQTTTVMPRTVMTEKSWGGPRRTEMTTILDYLEETVLMLAIKRRRLEIVDKLIKAGADVDADDCHGETALTLAVKDGLLGIVDKLIEAGADNLSLFDCDDLLHRAIDDGCERQVLVLLRAGADVEIEESGEGTPLSYAARLGETSMVSLQTARIRRGRGSRWGVVWDGAADCDGTGGFRNLRTFGWRGRGHGLFGGSRRRRFASAVSRGPERK